MPTRFPGSLCNFVRNRRRDLNKTQRTVADRVGVTSDFISLVESGERRMDLDKIPQLADALEVDRTELCRRALAERAPSLYRILFDEQAA